METPDWGERLRSRGLPHRPPTRAEISGAIYASFDFYAADDQHGQRRRHRAACSQSWTQAPSMADDFAPTSVMFTGCKTLAIERDHQHG